VIDAPTALHLGMINRMVPAAELPIRPSNTRGGFR
jgi:hypothetical protein